MKRSQQEAHALRLRNMQISDEYHHNPRVAAAFIDEKARAAAGVQFYCTGCETYEASPGDCCGLPRNRWEDTDEESESPEIHSDRDNDAA